MRDEAFVRLRALNGLGSILDRADHVDVKTVAGPVSLREFLAGMLNYKPAWLLWLFRLRGVLARIMGLEQAQVENRALSPEALELTPGRGMGFFTVAAATEDRYCLLEAEDRHLWAALAVVATPLPEGGNRFDVATLVNYRHWTGPVYFNLIRPFHHLVVACMAKAGATRGR